MREVRSGPALMYVWVNTEFRLLFAGFNGQMVVDHIYS